jgi:hypothetical protein
MVKSFEFDVYPTAAALRDDGTLDAVITRQDISGPLVRPVDVHLSMAAIPARAVGLVLNVH